MRFLGMIVVLGSLLCIYDVIANDGEYLRALFRQINTDIADVIDWIAKTPIGPPPPPDLF